MKKLLAIAVMAFLVCFAFGGCNTDDGTYTEPISLYEKVGGTWSITRMKQIDEFAKANGGKIVEMDLSAQFGFDTFGIRLSVDESHQPTTFAVSGTAPALFPVSGYWDLSGSFQNWTGKPVELRFWADAAKTKKTGSVLVTSVPGVNASLELTLIRTTKGVPFVSYTYTLIPANN